MPELLPVPLVRLPRIIFVDEQESSLPLEHTSVSVTVTGPVASVTVIQRFGNPISQPAELDYLFPLPDNAAITAFQLRIGNRQIEGDLQEQEAAQRTYEEALTQGRRAGLFEQRRPNLFAVRLANVQPGETIHTTVRYQQRLKFEDDSYEFIYPMGITPKYNSPEHPEEAKSVQAPIAWGNEPVGPVEISLAIDAGLPVGDSTSPSHLIEAVRVDERRFQVRLGGEQIPDRDFVLRYPVAGEHVQAAGWTSGEPGQEIFLATLVPPRIEGEAESLPREFVFVLDRSGSMTGEPIKQARNALRACLRVLNPEDTFQILLFDNKLEWFQSEPSAVSQQSVDSADAYLSRVEGRGGTEIIGALEAVFTLPPDSQRTRIVVFLTDGAVSAEARALEGIRSRIGSARLFTFGIGPSVNRALLSRMASLGRGRAEFLQLNEDIEGAIIRFQDSISFPVITNLALVWTNGKAWDVYPERLPDLYYGQTLEICGRLARFTSTPAGLVLRGQRAGKPVELNLALPAPAGKDAAVGRVWAKARVDHLLEQQELEPGRADNIRSEILGLAFEYGLVTVYTSFVAVDQDTTQSGQKPRIIHVAQPLPQGLSPQAFGPGNMGVMQMGMAVPPPSPAAMPSAASVSFARPLRAMAARLSKDMQAGDGQRLFKENVHQPAKTGVQETLRWLARTQKMNGSWEEDVEWTAAALLAFIRAGHTTRAGSFRQVLRRASGWLGSHADQGFAGFLRALALEDLAAATRDIQDQAAAQSARSSLPAPVNILEQAASGVNVKAPEAVENLDDLRLAGVLHLSMPIPEKLYRGEKADLARVWSAVMPG